eukprot:TRINITY_DN1069_c0_g2_i1.p2 TRINITY_DN1069_c0_g2~~TRINITY_DN1069_c0_g2_i1.p2  ORF type:complete len:110 (+),score=7.77 TRINITY_DN1069_c0_g2_i1:16-345(+)
MISLRSPPDNIPPLWGVFFLNLAYLPPPQKIRRKGEKEKKSRKRLDFFLTFPPPPPFLQANEEEEEEKKELDVKTNMNFLHFLLSFLGKEKRKVARLSHIVTKYRLGTF